MLQSKRGNLIIALILAIALWIYVVGELNPTTTKTFKEIPIKLIHEETLTKDGLSVVGSSDAYVTVTISGSRSAVQKVSESDVSAVVDLSDAIVGENKLNVIINVPNNVEVKDQSIRQMDVSVERDVTESRDVQVVFDGENANESEATVISIDPQTVSVTGGESQLAKVAYVKAEVSLNDLSDQESTVKASLVPVNKKGNKVEHVSLSVSQAEVVAAIYGTKTVGLKVPITGEDSGNASRQVTVPESVIIKGAPDAMKKVNSITADSLDVSKIMETKRVALSFSNLPEGIEIVTSPAKLKAKVTVADAESTKKFTFRGKDVEITDVAEHRKAEVAENPTITVEITGTASQLEEISEKDITLTASAKDITEIDTHTLEVTAVCDKSYGSLSLDTDTIQVKISE